MPRTVEFQGTIHEFPDNATDDQVRAALQSVLRASTPATTPPDKPGALSQIGTSLKNQAKGIFDTLTTLVDPVMAQKTGEGILDASSEQWTKAKAAAKAGNYGEALHRALTTVPIVGPMVQSIIDKAPERPYEAATDVIVPLLAGAAGAKGGDLTEAAAPYARAATEAAKAGGKDVLVGSGKAAGAGATAYALSKLGPVGQMVDAVAGLNELSGKGVVTSGLKQAARGFKAGYEAGKASLAPEPAPAPPRTPIWTGPAGAPSAPADLTPIPGKLPSGRIPGGPAIDPSTGQILENVGGGQFKAPPEAPPAASPAATPPAPTAPAAPAAATPEITQIPATEHPGKVDFAARARAQRAEMAGPIAETLEKAGFTPDLAKKLAPKDWLRLSKADGIGVNIPPKLATAVINELDSRAAARDLAKTQAGVQAAADAGAAADATRRDTMIAPSAAYAEALKRPGALEAAKALADELAGTTEETLAEAKARRAAAAAKLGPPVNPRKAAFDAARAKQ